MKLYMLTFTLLTAKNKKEEQIIFQAKTNQAAKTKANTILSSEDDPLDAKLFSLGNEIQL